MWLKQNLARIGLRKIVKLFFVLFLFLPGGGCEHENVTFTGDG